MLISYAEAISSAIKEEMQRDPHLILIGEDVGRYGGVFKATKGLFDEFGEKRIKDTPISETAILGTAIGSAMLGYKVIAEIMYIDFLTIASEQLINQAAKLFYMSGGRVNVPIVVRTQCGAGIRNGAQHSQCLEAWYMHIPGLKVVMPSTPYDAKGLLKSAIRDSNPVLFIEHKKLYRTTGEVSENEYSIPLGKANIKKEGGDLTLISNSYMTLIADEAAQILYDKYQLDVEIIDLRSISPLDKKTIVDSVKKTNRVAILNEACEQGSIASEICALIQSEVFDYLDYPVLRICGPNTPVPYTPELEDYFVTSPLRAADKIASFFKLRSI